VAEGVDAVRRQLEDADSPAAHAVAAPAEDHGVDPPGQDSLQQHLSLTLMKQPAKDEVHSSRKNVSGFRRQNEGKPVKKVKPG
jgi:hypothetical protein